VGRETNSCQVVSGIDQNVGIELGDRRGRGGFGSLPNEEHRRAGHVYARLRRTKLIPSRRAKLAVGGPGGRSKCTAAPKLACMPMATRENGWTSLGLNGGDPEVKHFTPSFSPSRKPREPSSARHPRLPSAPLGHGPVAEEERWVVSVDQARPPQPYSTTGTTRTSRKP
jgi:hypothetical protein